MPRKAAFTLLELMIVVAILAVLATLALPSLTRARRRAYNTRYIEAVRVASDAFTMYAAEHNAYPPDGQPGQIPEGMDTYLGKFPWTAPTPIGGEWDWDYLYGTVKASVSVLKPTVPLDQLLEIDAQIDDGNAREGNFRCDENLASFVVEQ